MHTTPERLPQLQHHFTQVSLIHDAVIRGDLPAVRELANLITDLGAPRDVSVSAAPDTCLDAAGSPCGAVSGPHALTKGCPKRRASVTRLEQDAPLHR